MDLIRLYKQDYVIPDSAKSFVVDLDSNDDDKDPMKWSLMEKISCTVVLTLMAFFVTLASAIGSGTYNYVSAEFGVSKEVAELTTSMYLVGFAIGAPFLAPLCEEVGRLSIYIIGMLLFSLFQIGAATSQNMASLAICRFFAGFFGTTPLSNAGGSIADIWEPDMRTIMFPLYGLAGFLGPVFGPLVGSYLAETNDGWRWTNYLVAILGFVNLLVIFFFMPETFRPIITDIKAAKIRKMTGDKAFLSIHEVQRQGRSMFSWQVFLRPFLFAVFEPIVTSFTIVITITYIVLFTDFEAFPIIFSIWGFSPAKSSLPFIAVALGILFTMCVITPISYAHFMREARKSETERNLQPEIRLIPLMAVCWCIPVSLFWIAWVTYDSISPWAAIISTFFFGVGLMQVFLTTYSYLIDSYGSASASALSTLTLVRYNASAGMVHVADPMYKNLGIHWAATLLAFLAVLLCAVPFFFWFYGPRIRSYSKYTVKKH